MWLRWTWVDGSNTGHKFCLWSSLVFNNALLCPVFWFMYFYTAVVYCLCSVNVDLTQHWKKYFSLYPVIVGGVGVLVTGNNLWCHPVGCTDEGVPAAHCPVQLGTHSEIHWEATKCKMICENEGHGVAPTVTVRHSADVNIPSLTSAFSVSRTFWPFMSLWMTLWAWRWERPWANTDKSNRWGVRRRGEVSAAAFI